MTAGSRVAVIVLAAGGSTRLGQPKQLLSVDGQPLLSRALDLVRRRPLQPRLVVLGGYEQAIREAVSFEGFTTVSNPAYAEGQSTSLIAGLRALPDDVDGVLILLGDQPLVPPGVIGSLLEAFDPDRDAAVRARYEGRPGNPVLLNSCLFPELLQISGDVGARDVLRQHREKIRDVDVTGWPVPRDVDTMKDYERLLVDWASLGAPDVPGRCQRCGGPMHAIQRHDRLRPVCPACDFTAFYDPKISAATIIEIDGKIVMLKRAGDPGRGLWTFPSGFVDRGEPVRVAAAREVLEEVGIIVSDLTLLDVFSEPGGTVVLVVFTTRVEGQMPVIGHESTDVALVDPDDLPELAFPRDREIIEQWKQQRVTDYDVQIETDDIKG